MIPHVLAGGEQVVGLPGTVVVALIGAITAAAGVWGSRRSSADSASVARDQNTWERMESLLAERDRTVEALRDQLREGDVKIARLERALRDAGIPLPD